MNFRAPLFFSLFFLFACNNAAQNTQPIKEPVQSGTSAVLTNSFIIRIADRQLSVISFGKSVPVNNWQELDALIKQTDLNKPDVKISIQTNSSDKSLVDSAIAVLERNKYYKFTLFSELEK
jgi:hypothetical protein